MGTLIWRVVPVWRVRVTLAPFRRNIPTVFQAAPHCIYLPGTSPSDLTGPISTLPSGTATCCRPLLSLPK
jgi:hypothetical protein